MTAGWGFPSQGYPKTTSTALEEFRSCSSSVSLFTSRGLCWLSWFTLDTWKQNQGFEVRIDDTQYILRLPNLTTNSSKRVSEFT